MKKKLLVLTTVMIMSVAMTGCGGETDVADSTTEATTEQTTEEVTEDKEELLGATYLNGYVTDIQDDTYGWTDDILMNKRLICEK